MARFGFRSYWSHIKSVIANNVEGDILNSESGELPWTFGAPLQKMLPMPLSLQRYCRYGYLQ